MQLDAIPRYGERSHLVRVDLWEIYAEGNRRILGRSGGFSLDYFFDIELEAVDVSDLFYGSGFLLDVFFVQRNDGEPVYGRIEGKPVCAS